MSKKQDNRRLWWIIIQQVIWDANWSIHKKIHEKTKSSQIIIEIDLEIRSCKFGITQTTTQSRNSQCNCKKLLTRQDLFFFLVKNPMNNYLIFILGQMKHYSETDLKILVKFVSFIHNWWKWKKICLRAIFFQLLWFFWCCAKKSNGGELRNSVGKLLESPQDRIWGSDGGFGA